VTAPDLTNAAFELVGGLCAWLSFAKLWADQQVKGVSLTAVAFFTVWGAWNCYYYPWLGQTASFVGGLVLLTGNGAWLVLAWIVRLHQ
jgi:hypothetical protein